MNIRIPKQALLFTALLLPATAKSGDEFNVPAVTDDITIVEPAAYEAGRGLITLEGPSGMFINPTSGVLPQGYYTAQYCMFLPNQNTDVIGHGFMAAYGFTDWLEAGALGKYIDRDFGDNLGSAGPFARIRFLQNDGAIPQLSLGGYANFGDDPLENQGLFSAAYWRIPIQEDGFVKSLGIHAGVRANWFDVGPSDAIHGYGGVELQLPLRFYLVGEASTRDNDVDSEEAPYAFGVQWRLAMINISLAGIQTGSLPDGPALYWGIGAALSF